MDGERLATSYEIDVMLTAYGQYIKELNEENYDNRMFYSDFLQSIGCKYLSDGLKYRTYHIVDESKFMWSMLKYNVKNREEN